MPTRRLILAALLLTGGAALLPAVADGDGIGNVDWSTTDPPRDPFELLATFDGDLGTPNGHGFVALHRGYLLVPFSNDGGGGGGSGGFAFVDLSDPANPRKVFSTRDDLARYHPDLDDKDGDGNKTNDPGDDYTHYAGNIREPHGYSISGDTWCMTSNGGGETGLQFWDLADVERPSKLASMPLPGLGGGDYGNTAWWVFWQGGRYAYVAGTGDGLYIVDASDPANPVLADRGGAPNPIPTGSAGGFRINTVFAVGNLLVIAKSDGGGIATFDISDPLHPTDMKTSSGAVGYSMQVNGRRILGANDPARVFPISAEDFSIGEAVTGPDVAGKGGYGAFQDGVFHYGSSSAYVKLDISSQPFTSLGTASPSGFGSPDWDFGTPLGNLTFMGNDHGGSALIVHQQAPDTAPPAVNMVVPADGAVDQATSSRVGLTFTDQIDGASLSTATIQVRPVGGAALTGRFSNQTGIVNFWPDEPLADDATYEVVVAAGGLRDLVGNAIAETFTSRFSTGSSLDAEPAVAITDPVEGDTVGPDLLLHFLASNWTIEAGGDHVHWSLDGVDQGAWTSGDPIPVDGLSAGSHELCVELYEAGHVPTGIRDCVTVTVAESLTRTITISRPDPAFLWEIAPLPESQSQSSTEQSFEVLWRADGHLLEAQPSGGG